MNRLIPALLLTLVVASPWRAAAQTTPPPLSFQITDLPLLPNTSSTRASAINNAGQVVGTTISTKSKTFPGWLWTPATTTTAANLETLAILSNFTRCDPKDINDAGQVVGTSIAVSNKRATLWLPGQLATPIDFTAAADKGGFLRGWVLREAISMTNPDANGIYLVVGVGDYTDPVTLAVTTHLGVVWKMQGGAMLSAAPLNYPAGSSATPWTSPQSINNQGQVSGDYTSDKNVFGTPVYCCVWNALDGSVIRLDALGSQNNHLISDAGTVLGERSGAYLCAAPYTTVDRLGTQLAGPDGPSQTIPNGINHRNQVAGQVTYASTAVRAACFWQLQVDAVTGQPLRDATGTLLYYFYDLNKCSITGTSVATRLWDAKGINDSGWIIGRGTTSNSERPYLLTPIK